MIFIVQQTNLFIGYVIIYVIIMYLLFAPSSLCRQDLISYPLIHHLVYS